MHDIHLCDWLIVEGDPGVPSGAVGDPLAGLDLGTARRVMDEAKQVGTASMRANVGARDAKLRRQVTGTPSRQRDVLRLAAKNVQRRLAPVVGEAGKRLRGYLSSWLAGRLTYNEVRVRTAAALREAYEQVRQIGRDAAGLDRLGASDRLHREEERWFRTAVREELRYWNTFLDQINEGAVPEKRMWERMDMYVRALRFMFEAARTQALPDTVLLHWIGPKKDDPNICAGCVQMMEWSPFPKELIPAVPRDGSTPCLTNCRHKVMVRVAQNYNDVIRRKNQLEGLVESRTPREAMIRKLKRIKEARHGRRRNLIQPGGRASNPFKGEPLPKAPTYRGRLGQMRMEAMEQARAMLVDGVGSRQGVQIQRGGNLVTARRGRSVRVDATREGRALTIVGAEAGPSERGRGLGVQAYADLLGYARDHGLEVRSDSTVELPAAHVWRALKRRGYRVVEHPNAVLDDSDPDMPFLYVRGGGLEAPVFTALREAVAPTSSDAETAGVFLRLPRALGDQFPAKGSEDKSPPHVTMLFVGDVDASDYQKVVDAAHDVCKRLRPFVVEMTDYGEFENHKGQTIAHMIPRSLDGPELALIHDALYTEMLKRGLAPSHTREGAFKPHATLAYVDPGKRYSGPRPAGTFRVDCLEVWGSGVWGEGELGNTRIPLGAGAPIDVSEAKVQDKPHRSFDATPYSTMDLRDVARLLVRAARARDAKLLPALLDRVLGALEHTTIAIEGRPRGWQVAQLLRQAFGELADAMAELPESVALQALQVQELVEGRLHQ